MDFFVVQLLTGLATGASLFLVAAGLTLIFGVTRIVNFAHGSLCMLGAYIGWSVLTRLPRDPASFALGVVVTALAVAVIGIVVEVGLLRRLYRAPELFQLLATFAVLLIVQDATQAIWGAGDLALPRPAWLRDAVRIGEARFATFDIVRIGLAPAVLGCLWLLMRHTRFGMLARAATENRALVAALGVNEARLFTAVFALGAGLAGFGGVLSLPSASANLQIDLSVVVEAFVVVVVGGMGSLGGAYLASVGVGVLQAFGAVLLPAGTLVLVFAAMAVVLAVWPRGLFGTEVASEPASHRPRLVRPASARARLAAVVALAAALAAPLLAGPFAISVLTEAMIAILFAASLHFAMGPGGMPSFGHAAWFAIGAYAAGLLARDAGGGMVAGLLLAPVAAGLVALGFGWFVVRLSGVYMAMLTLAFAQIVWAASSQLVALTGGDNGILGLRPASFASDPSAFYWLTLVVGLGGAMALRWAIFSPFGYALRAARDHRGRAEAIGLPVATLRLVAFGMAGAMAGLAGAEFAYAKGSVFPTYAGVGKSVEALLMVLLGGVETIAGPVVGALAYSGLFDVLLLATQHWQAVLGGVILAAVLVFPDGIAGASSRFSRR